MSILRTSLSVGAVLALVGAGTLAAQGDEFYAWTAPDAQQQLAADATEIPAGQGAIFVPAMSKGADEPEVLIFSGESKVAGGVTGKRIVVAPGSYVVRVGSGAVKQMLEAPVTVAAGATAEVPVSWGGLKIEVVDEQNIPPRGTYELIRSAERELYGIGYGADTLQAEPLQTWLLRPGLYRVVRTGETYRARKDFATVFVPEGGLVHFKLVIDPGSGNFRGAGVVTPAEMGVKTAEAVSNWTRRVTFGAAATLNSTDKVVGAANQTSFTGLGFLDAYLTYENGPHFASGIFELEEGFLQVDPEEGKSLPTQQIQDRLRTDVVYTRFLNERWGPYARFGLLTNVFPAETLATEPVTVAYNRLDGTRTLLDVPANEQYRTADGFGSLRLREGFGINVRLLRNRTATVNWRGGVGFRQNRFNDAFVVSDLLATPELDLFEIDDVNQEGFETTVTGNVRLTRVLSYITDLEVFADLDDTGEPTLDWRNTLSFRLTRYLSIDYTLDLLRLPQVLDETQTRQNLLLRVSFDVL